MELGFNGIQDLAKLLKCSEPVDNGSDSENEASHQPPSSKLGPGSFGPPKKSSLPSTGQGHNKAKQDNKEIWTTEEAKYSSETGETFDLSKDPREKPNFEMYYRQAVTTEDVYLQMSGKTPCTASCENLVIVIDLPGENFKQVKLDIKTELLTLRSPKYIFRLSLPHPVDPNAGNAKWDQDKEKLTVSLKLTREYDALNF